MTPLLAISQRPGRKDGAPWVVEGGERIEGQEDGRRLTELYTGLARHYEIDSEAADASDERVEQVLRTLHDPDYLDALHAVDTDQPFLMPGFATPGLAPDIPVSAPLVAAAYEGVRTAVTAAERIVAGARLTYAVCRPPGHHAGPAWFGGYCYLNNAAAAVRVLVEGGIERIAVLDLDLHYPNGTAALLASMPEATLHSLHASPVTNVPPGTVLPWAEGEEAIAFEEPPDEDEYLTAVAGSLLALSADAGALVLSLGYDTVAGDPHGSWGFSPEVFTQIGAMVAVIGLPVCVIQEGGYALPLLADCADAFATGLLAGEAGEYPPQTSELLKRLQEGALR